MTETMAIVETAANALIFVYVGVLVWLYVRAEDD